MVCMYVLRSANINDNPLREKNLFQCINIEAISTLIRLSSPMSLTFDIGILNASYKEQGLIALWYDYK